MEGPPSRPDSVTTGGTTTIPEEPTGDWNRWERRLHAVSIGLVVAVSLLAMTGIIGVRTGTVSATGQGFRIAVLHSQVTRAGLATPWSVTLSREDGEPLPKVVTMAVTTSYLAIFDLNGLSPAPTQEFSNEDWTWWDFEVPPHATSLRIDLDVRLEPAVQWARSGTAALEIEGQRLVSADFTTWVMP